MKKIYLLGIFASTCLLIGCGANNNLESEYEQLQWQYESLESNYEQLQSEYNALIESETTDKVEISDNDIELPYDGFDCSFPVYGGQYGNLTLTRVSSQGIVFIIENTTEDAYTVYSDYVRIDDTVYNDDWDNGIGLTYENIASEDESEISFVAPIDNLDFKTISGQFLICDFETGENLGLISFQDVNIN